MNDEPKPPKSFQQRAAEAAKPGETLLTAPQPAGATPARPTDPDTWLQLATVPASNTIH